MTKLVTRPLTKVSHHIVWWLICVLVGEQTRRQAGRQEGRWTERRTGRQADSEMGRQADRLGVRHADECKLQDFAMNI